MSKSDSDSEQSYCSDDSEFNYIPSPYVIEAIDHEDEEANANEAAASPDDTLDPDTVKPCEDEPIASEEWVSEYEKKDKKPRQSLKGSLRIVMKEYNLCIRGECLSRPSTYYCHAVPSSCYSNYVVPSGRSCTCVILLIYVRF